MLLYQGQPFPFSDIFGLYVFRVFELQRVILILLYSKLDETPLKRFVRLMLRYFTVKNSDVLKHNMKTLLFIFTRICLDATLCTDIFKLIKLQ